MAVCTPRLKVKIRLQQTETNKKSKAGCRLSRIEMSIHYEIYPTAGKGRQRNVFSITTVGKFILKGVKFIAALFTKLLRCNWCDL
jgi:hypothetical protein